MNAGDAERGRIKAVGHLHTVGPKHVTTVETPVSALVSEPQCPVCKTLRGLRSEVEMVIRRPPKAEMVVARMAEVGAGSATLLGPRVAEIVLKHSPGLGRLLRRARDTGGGEWWELIAPADVLYCGLRGVGASEVPFASRCGLCGALGAYLVPIKYLGTTHVVAESDVSDQRLFRAIGWTGFEHPQLLATGEGIRVLRDHGFRFEASKVAVLRAAEVERHPEVKVFHEPV